jgi:hypothetical protein
MRRSRIGLLFPICLLGACVLPDGAAGGRLEAHWTGADTGKISGPAIAQWCHIRRLLEIRTIQGDTGVALALYPAESVSSGTYRVVDPPKAESLPPAAGVAVRWFAVNAVKGFQGESGTVVLEQSKSGKLSGTVTAAARSVADTQRIAITGKFQSLSVQPQTLGCDPRLEDPEADAQPGAPEVD